MGRYRGPGGGILEKLWDVDQVFADGHLVGVVSRRDRAAFQPRAGIDPTTADTIAAKIEELQQMVDEVTGTDGSEQEDVGDDWTE